MTGFKCSVYWHTRLIGGDIDDFETGRWEAHWGPGRWWGVGYLVCLASLLLITYDYYSAKWLPTPSHSGVILSHFLPNFQFWHLICTMLFVIATADFLFQSKMLTFSINLCLWE